MYFFCFARCVFHVIVYIVMRYLVRCSASGFCIVSKFRVKSVLMSVR